MLTNRSKFSKVFTIVTLIAVLYLLFIMGDIKPVLTDHQLTISTTGYTKTTINLDQIEKITLVDKWEKGNRSFGIGTPKISVGTYKTSALPSYHLYILNDINKFIVIEYKGSDGKLQTLTFNCEDEQTTVKWYNDLQSKLS